MFHKLGTAKLVRNRKTYLRILAILLKVTCEGVYILHSPAYILEAFEVAASYNNNLRFNAPLESIAIFFRAFFINFLLLASTSLGHQC